MLPGFFLDIAENTGDGFSYVILPVNNISDIPTARNPVTLVRSVVLKCDLSVDTAPRCVQTREGFKFYNRNDVELLGDEELDIVEDDLNEYLSVSEDEQDSIMESYSFLSEHSDAPVETSLAHLDRDMLSYQRRHRSLFRRRNTWNQSQSKYYSNVIQICLLTLQTLIHLPVLFLW